MSGLIVDDGSNKENIGIFFSSLMSVLVAKIQIIGTLRLVHSLRQRRILNIIARIDHRCGILRSLTTIENGRQNPKRRFWVRPGRTDGWWNNFVNNLVVPEEWRENFRMSRDNFFLVCNRLRPILEKQSTNMRQSTTVVLSCCKFDCLVVQDDFQSHFVVLADAIF